MDGVGGGGEVAFYLFLEGRVLELGMLADLKREQETRQSKITRERKREEKERKRKADGGSRKTER